MDDNSINNNPNNRIQHNDPFNDPWSDPNLEGDWNDLNLEDDVTSGDDLWGNLLEENSQETKLTPQDEAALARLERTRDRAERELLEAQEAHGKLMEGTGSQSEVKNALQEVEEAIKYLERFEKQEEKVSKDVANKVKGLSTSKEELEKMEGKLEKKLKDIQLEKKMEKAKGKIEAHQTELKAKNEKEATAIEDLIGWFTGDNPQGEVLFAGSGKKGIKKDKIKSVDHAASEEATAALVEIAKVVRGGYTLDLSSLSGNAAALVAEALKKDPEAAKNIPPNVLESLQSALLKSPGDSSIYTVKTAGLSKAQKNKAGLQGAAAGAGAGAGLGATIGSIVPGLGTIVGAIIGAGSGAFIGGIVGRKRSTQSLKIEGLKLKHDQLSKASGTYLSLSKSLESLISSSEAQAKQDKAIEENFKEEIKDFLEIDQENSEVLAELFQNYYQAGLGDGLGAGDIPLPPGGGEVPPIPDMGTNTPPTS
ncbi:MAG: hypothetical protein KDK66_04805 [Deltaproteobacteria bacterium]|nr:hypothetical protein [Deltaproteobacteria bacterium]